ncbi:MAG: hypothetical protein A2355_16480 [Spirochaetes bacterium RIFOXYB1_FULL_32_8]|nr:MAG: hypothetical protein A2355_16480 [Spirochaetes bacterium RIFOXYB1_FULL_32_8]
MSGLDEVFKKIFYFVFGKSAHLLTGELAVFEDNQGGDGNDVEAASQVGLVVDIYLDNLDFAGIGLGQFVKVGPDDPAGHAPLGPEID